MKQWILGSVAAGLLVCATVVMADGVKIGYVDVRAVVLESKSGQQHKADMEKFVKDKQGALKKTEEKLKAEQQTLEKEMLTLTESQKQDKQRAFQEKVQAFQKSAQEAERELRTKDNEYTSKALEEVHKLVAEVAKEEKISLMLGKTEMSVLYAEDGMDMTQKVIQLYNKRASKK